MNFRYHSRVFFLAGVLGLGVWAMAPQAASVESSGATANGVLERKIKKTINHWGLNEANVGVFVRTLREPKVAVNLGGDTPMNPASNFKLLTSFVALEELGPMYRFKTTLSAQEPLARGTLTNLYVTGSGDPYMVVERLWRMAGDLYVRGLRKIQGDIVIDGSLFDNDLHTDNWPDEPGPQAYFAPTAAFAVNFNTVAFYVTPGARPGDEPQVVIDPQVDAVHYSIEAKTTASSTKKKVLITRDPQLGGDNFKIRGQIPINYQFRKPTYRNVREPLQYAGEVFKSVLVNRGIAVSGKVRLGKTPSGAREIFVEESPELADLLKFVNKNSNNFMTEQILKTLAAEKTGKPGRTDAGVKILTQHLQELGFSPKDFQVENGSGLSRNTRISPKALVTILETAWRDPAIHPEYISSLALGGCDGTLEDRQKDKVFHTKECLPRLRAKTGSLRGVSSLSGFLTRADGETLAFCILMNNLSKPQEKESHQIQDEILKLMAEEQI